MDELFLHYIFGTDEQVLLVTLCSVSKTVITGHRIVLILSTSVHMKPGSASACGLKSLGTLSYAPVCYLTCWLLNDRIFWKLFYCSWLKVYLYLWGTSTPWGTCLAVVEWKVDWTLRMDCKGSLVTRSNSDGFYSVRIGEGAYLCSPSKDCWKISWQDFKHPWQQLMPTC